MLISVACRDAGDDESRAARDELDPFDCPVRMRILPAPQEVPGGPSHGVLGQALPGRAPAAFETRQAVVAGVGDGEERETAPPRRHHLDLEPLPDRHGGDLAAVEAENVLRGGPPGRVTGRRTRFEQPVRDDHPPRRQPIPTGVGTPGSRKHRSGHGGSGPIRNGRPRRSTRPSGTFPGSPPRASTPALQTADRSTG